MAETPKYYTPIRSEFHIGFEYQQNASFIKLAKSEGWQDVIFDVSQKNILKISLPNYKCYKEHLRVKYLDGDDIISCGWKNVWNESFERVFQLNDWTLTFNLEHKWIQINKGTAVYYRGKPKNISEFKLITKSIEL